MESFPFDTPHQPGTIIDWYLERMAASGIPKPVATKCGFRLELDDVGAYFAIPYFTVDGVQTTYERHRNRDERVVYEGHQSGGNFKGKYTQPKGTKNRIYWPPLTNQRPFFNSPWTPLIVCEGELKSVACQMSSAKEQFPALICGMPGTKLCPNTRAELELINCSGRGENDKPQHRQVFLALDWNVHGNELENLLQMELALRKLFQGLGAEVFALRWPTESGEVQKLDDWLTAGGHLSDAISFTLEHHHKVVTEYQEAWDYLNESYVVCHGRYIPLSNMSKQYSSTDLNTMEGGCRIQVSPKKFIHAAEIWNLQPNKDKNIVDGYIFRPPPLGREPERYVWEDGVRLLNTAPLGTWSSPVWRLDQLPDIAPFKELLSLLCQDGAEWMLQFIAQAAQCPTERGPHIIIFKDNGGTGKSRLFDTLDLVFGRYSGPVGTSMTSNFNGSLEHLIFAHWSDPAFARWMDLDPKLKGYSGDTKLAINHKYGAEYTVQNYGRLLIATNKDWIVPIQQGERRYTVFGGTAPMTHHKASEYMSWLRNGGVDAIRNYIVQMDLTGFDIQAPGPRTAQRAEMEKDSAPPLHRLLESEVFESRDIWAADQIRQIYFDQTGKKLSVDQIGKELAKLKFVVKKVRVEGDTSRLWAIRSPEKWEAASPDEWRGEFKRFKAGV